MAETRVNLKHLLEDLKDAYPFPQEEVIVSELIANALDSGGTSIDFLVTPVARAVSVIDNGRGMARRDLGRYHDIAATTKTRGRGIGFAGVGAKLALLIAEEVVTETRRGRYHGATRWHLETPQRAPWRKAKPGGLITGPSGTAVSIILRDAGSSLLQPSYVSAIIRRHYASLLDDRIAGALINTIYRRRPAFTVNSQPVELAPEDRLPDAKEVTIRAGTRSRFVGVGVVGESSAPVPDEDQGIAVSTYGKVIKRGWEWLGLRPRQPDRIRGIVEVPQLAAILNTSKSDFLRDGASMWRYYKIRRAILRAVEPVLNELGEAVESDARQEKSLRRAERDLNMALGDLAGDFPELAALLGHRRQYLPNGDSPPPPEPAETSENTSPEEDAGIARRESPETPPLDAAGEDGARPRRSGLRIEYESRPDRAEPAWLAEDVIRVNVAHPAYLRAREKQADDYHLAFATAWALSNHLSGSVPAQDFINRFLTHWARRA